MKQIMTIARRELSGYFRSPVALIFLGTFLFVTMFAFFWVDTFFRRNIADIRPLFHWLPVLLIFLVGALTMRLWSEEQRAGTIEVLLTMPVRTSRLVWGKFLGGLALVGVALALTFSLPITVAVLGDLDWGPVVGGYLGALLLAAAYLAIGLCFSASTDNPIVALITTCVACGVLYLFGSEMVVSFAGNRWTEMLQALGTGSRFESIQRGVLDLRDLVYYGSITVGFLFLNIVILEAKRWSKGESTKALRSSTKLGVGLVFANVLVLNVMLAPVGWARVDLTERNEYSVSPVTRKLLKELDAPLTIRGYVSAKTHPLLAPLVPRIRDMIKEYAVIGGSNVVGEFIDPRDDTAVEKEANESYGIKSVPFQFADRHETAVVNSYFSLLVKYGDKYEVLGFEDLIEVKVTGFRDIEVKLRNLEYDLTRAIKKVTTGFEPLENLFARAPSPIKLTAYLSEKTLPKAFKDVPAHVRELAEELTKQSGGKFVFETIDPTGPSKEGLRQELFQKYRFKPMAASLFSEDMFYCHLLIQQGERFERVYPAPEMSKADVRTEVTAAMKRLSPGFLKTIGLFAPEPTPPQQNPMMRRPPPAERYQLLREKLGETYTMRDVDLKDGRVPGDVDVLLIVGGRKLDDKQKFAIDQYLMRGGSVVALTGSYSLDPGGMGNLAVKKEQSGLEDLLQTWGIKLGAKMVLDPQNEAFPVPVERNLGGLSVREIQLINYPFWVDVRRTGMSEDNPVVAGLPSVTLQWVSPLEYTEQKGIKANVLLRSSKGSWTQESTEVQPNFAKYPQGGFGPEGAQSSHILGLALTGSFKSHFADKPSPLFTEENKDAAQDKANANAKSDRTGRTVKQSPETARLAVVGSGDFVGDIVLSLSRQTGSERFTNNLQLAQNLMDWSLADVDLLSIRSRGTYARTLSPMSETARSTWETVNYGVVLAALGLIIGFAVIRRRGVVPMKLVATKQRAKED